jgi:hypothetical protein
MVRELHYEDALAHARALRDTADTPPEIRLRAIELEALADLGLGDVPAARAAFADLVRLDPGYHLTDARPSPRVIDLFREVREQRPHSPPEDLVVAVAPPTIEGAPAAVTALPTGEHALRRVVFRVSARTGEVEVAADPDGPPWRADIPVESIAAAAELAVVARGYAPSGELAAVSHVGRVPPPEAEEEDEGVDHPASALASHPTVRHPRRREPGLTDRPWFWAIVGVVVVVGTFTVIALTFGGGSGAPASGSEAH